MLQIDAHNQSKGMMWSQHSYFFSIWLLMCNLLNYVRRGQIGTTAFDVVNTRLKQRPEGSGMSTGVLGHSSMQTQRRASHGET